MPEYSTGITPTVRILRSKNEPHHWSTLWYLGDRPMESHITAADRQYIETNYDVQVDTCSVAETFEFLIVTEKAGTL